MKRMTILLSALLTLGWLLSCVSEESSAAPAPETPKTTEKTITTNVQGTDGGYFYSFWTDGGGSVAMTLDGANGYRVRWTNSGNFTCGKGWAVGSGHAVTYSGYFTTSGQGFFGMYGWTIDPLIEYYAIETWGEATNPANSGTSIGTLVSDGDTYDVYREKRVDQPSIQGTATFFIYKSFRRTPRTSGTVTMQNHFDGWEKLGLKLGKRHNYQILLCEGFQSSGSGGGTISEAGK